MARREGLRRLQEEYRRLHADPPPFVIAEPNDKNLYEWYFVILGPPDSDYLGGEYCGTITFPPDYPMRPPRIKMLTPSGRFTPHAAICFSFSDFHPETWQPGWTIGTVLTGLLSFMTTEEMTTGSMRESAATRRRLAQESRLFNERKIPGYQHLYLQGHGQQALQKAKDAAAEFVQSMRHATVRSQTPTGRHSSTLIGTAVGLFLLLALLGLIFFSGYRVPT